MYGEWVASGVATTHRAEMTPIRRITENLFICACHVEMVIRRISFGLGQGTASSIASIASNHVECGDQAPARKLQSLEGGDKE